MLRACVSRVRLPVTVFLLLLFNVFIIGCEVVSHPYFAEPVGRGLVVKGVCYGFSEEDRSEEE